MAYFIFKSLDRLFSARPVKRRKKPSASRNPEKRSKMNKNAGEYINYEEVKGDKEH
jgi:hypothetical protein|tara:strand:- start:418 stop:585 length:168 start_codon:yes stop_codon:yes gene_type:complete